jgi:hypothetical protein
LAHRRSGALRFLILHPFDDVRRKTKFIAVKIVPNTTSRGITPGPKLTASPIIHRRMASVKIVQNTTLLLNGWSSQDPAAQFTVSGPERPFGHGLDSARFLTSEKNLPIVLIQNIGLQVV